MLVEPFQTRQARHVDLDPFTGEVLGGLQGQVHLGSGGHDRCARFGRMPDEVSTGVHALKDRGRFGVEYREALSAQDDSDRFPAAEDGEPGGGRLACVRRAAHGKPGDGAKGPQMLDRLVRRSILTQADGVVRPHKGARCLHQRGKSNGAAHVVAEHQESPTEGPREAIEGDAIDDGPHGVLANTEVDNPTEGRGCCGFLRQKALRTRNGGVVGLSQIR